MLTKEPQKKPILCPQPRASYQYTSAGPVFECPDIALHIEQRITIEIILSAIFCSALFDVSRHVGDLVTVPRTIVLFDIHALEDQSKFVPPQKYIVTLDYDCFMSEISRLWPTADRIKVQEKSTIQRTWAMTMMWILLHDPLVQPRPGFVSTNLKWRSIASLPGPKKWPGNWTKISFCFFIRMLRVLGYILYHRYVSVWKRCKWLPRTSQHWASVSIFCWPHKWFPLSKKDFLHSPPVPKTPQLPNPPHTFVSSCPFPRSYVLGADSSNGATELQPADFQLRIQLGSCCQQFAW